VTPTPHDALVRAIFGQPRYAAEELRAAVDPELLAELELGSLASVDGSFIDEELRGSSADLLFSVDLRGGGEGFVDLLFEHQSTPDERLPLRLLRYQTRIFERHAAANPGQRTLPPILPLLLHQGERPWPWKPRFASLHALDERRRAAFGPKLLDFEFVLDDLAVQSDEQILSRASDAIVRLTLLALRNGRSHPRLYERIAAAMKSLSDDLRGPAAVPALFRLARYSLEVGDAPLELVHSTFVAALVPRLRSDAMFSTADRLRMEVRREVLLTLIETKFGPVSPETRDRIEQATNEQLILWFPRIVVAASLDELFAP
jgi:predicted transposase YdaD